jgi:hypothetical protein
MAIDQTQMMQAVYDAIFNAIATVPPGTSPTIANPILVVARPGLAVDPKDFTNALSATNPTGLTSSLEVFSDVIDPAPAFSAAYTPGASFEASYGEVTKGQADPNTPTPQQQAAFDKAKGLVVNDNGGQTPGVAAYLKAQAAYSAAILNYNSAYWGADLTTGAGQRAWQAKAGPLQATIKSSFSALSATQPGVYQGALDTMSQFGASSGDSALAAANQVYTAAGITSVLPGAGGTFWPAYAYPTDWMDSTSDSAYTEVTITSSALKTSKTSSYNAYSASGSASWGLWSVGGSSSGQFTHNTMSQSSSDLSVDFKFARVIVSRPWLNSGIYSLRGLQVGGRKEGAFSTGQANVQNSGITPLLCSSIIVAKEIKIAASWAQADADFISNSITASADVGWGPFKISGSYDHSSSSETMSSTFDGTTLTLPGLGIIGFVCTLVPLSPAIDG